MAIKQLKHHDEDKVNNFHKELEKALKKSEIIIQEIKEGTRNGYSNMEDLIKALNND